MPRRVWNLLRHGDLEGRYRSRSEVAAAIAMSFVMSGRTFGSYWAAANGPDNDGIYPWAWYRSNGRRRSPGDALRRVRTTWRSAQAHVAKDPAIRDRTAALAHLAEVRDAAAEPGHWRGISGATDRAVLGAALRIALSAHTVRPNLSCRRVGELAGVGRSTASRSLARLVERGWLRRARLHTSTMAAGFRFAIPGTRSHAGTCEAYVSHLGHDSSDAADVFRWHIGLGKVASGYYEVLCDHAVALEDVASAFGVEPRTARRHLERLRSFALAELTDGGWVRGRLLPEQAAHEMGASGAGHGQRRQHQRERSAYRDYRAHRAGQQAEQAGVLVRLRMPHADSPSAMTEVADVS
jgi:DNA-binding transcriptional ArsR family regulator